mmetsp:Transcript_34857/g.90322  ORF Transcript_34857/g.90322 Transcript_34857/m.90322 type:complete len:111 (-) Transcript_34857:783-1115(-)
MSQKASRFSLQILKSNKYIRAQIFDRMSKSVVAQSSSEAMKKESADLFGQPGQTASSVFAANLVGKAVAEGAQQAGVSSVHFDKQGRKIHGKIFSVLEALQEKGIVIRSA